VLYAQLLDASWGGLPEAIRALHTTGPGVRAHGRFRITNGTTRVSRALARVLHLPRADAAADIQLTITSDGTEESWRRTFDGVRLETRQFTAAPGVLGERIGALELRFRLEPSEHDLTYRQVGAALMLGAIRCRLPARLAPIVRAREEAAGARRIDVHVHVTVPAAGAILTYDGAVEVEPA
jgi:hypothetical protein